MKYFKRQKLFKASNVTYNPETHEARSYEWWIFVKKIGDLIVFNDYKYSVTTAKHQLKVRNLLQQNGISVDRFIQSPNGLQNLNSSIEFYNQAISELEAAIKKPRSNKKKNAERAETINLYKSKIKQVEYLKRLEGN